MFVKKCEFNEIRDIHDVDQFGYVNLAECLENGIVPSEIADSEANYNDVDDPSSIIGKPRDVFEAYTLKDYAMQVGKVETKSTE